ncbi:LicD family protein [Parabacteroides sp. 52]|uniref:LicD family protein n=1 Tax=unclassified Parabacteroides TaxID=2649774 RepID=UPI0013D2E2CE|nr:MULTISPECIES: LicD family protein [unclassified Parabacteroides]MDH6534539.1 lipopolysaccharide cholinephosphotransferase [Parabacteroides sp. PM5-20]NDV55225.1 LicD family protein [Parabacteroides sp. 52]
MENTYSDFSDNRATGETKLRQAQLVMLRMLRIVDHICQKHSISYWLCSGTLLGAVRHQGFIPWDDDLDICMMREDYEKFVRIAPTEFPSDLFLQTRETDPNYDYLSLPCKVRDLNSLFITSGQANKKHIQGIFIDIFPMDKYHSTNPSFFIERCIKRYNSIISRCLDAELYKHLSKKSLFISYFKPLFYGLKTQYIQFSQKRIRKNKKLGNESLIGHGFDTIWIRFFSHDEIFPLRKISFEGYPFYVPNNPDAYLTRLYGPDYMTPPPAEKRRPGHYITLEPIYPVPHKEEMNNPV